MAKKDNRRKHYGLTGALLALALLLGVERCMDESTESISSPQPTHKPSENSELPTVNPVAMQGNHPTLALQHGSNAHRKTTPKAVAHQNPLDTTAYTLSNTQQTATSPTPLNTKPTQQQQPQDTLCNDTSAAVINLPTTQFPQKHLFRLGIRAGIGYSKITGLGSTLESYNMRPQFTMSERGGIVPRIGIFGTWQYARIGAELGIDYTRLASKAVEHKTTQGVTETTKFHYNFITSQLLVRFYVFPKLYMGAGVSMSFPFGNRNIDFTDSRIGEVYRQQTERTQDHLRETIKARVLFSPTIKLGFADPKSGIEAGLEYSYGANDQLRTNMNDYGYQNRTNNAHNVSLTIGYSIPLNKEKKTTAHEEE